MKTRRLFQSLNGSALLASALVLVLVLPASAAAAVITGNLLVTLEVVDSCTAVTGTTLAFGQQATQFSASVAQEAEFKVRCAVGSVYAVGLDLGQHAQGSQRRMKNASGNTYVPYQVFHDATRQTAWGMSGYGLSTQSGNGLDQPFDVYGWVPQQSAVMPGKYQDTLKISVSY